MRLSRRGLFGLMAATSLSTPVLAQSRPIRLIVPYPPGGPTDALGRLAAQEIAAGLGQPVVVENLAGAAGTIGTRTVARGDQDGRTILLGSYQTHATAIPMMANVGYDPIRDFMPIAGLAELQHALVVKNDLPVRSVAELVALAKAQPGKLNYGSTGAGSLSHLGMEVFKLRTGTDLLHVPFSGSSPLVIELLAGRIDVSFATLPPILGQLRDGKMRPLALASGVRAPQMPDLPLLRDVGVQGSEADSWLALFARAGSPQAMIDRIAEVSLAAFAKPEVTARAVELGMVVNVRNQANLGQFVQSELARWTEIIRGANLRMEG